MKYTLSQLNKGSKKPSCASSEIMVDSVVSAHVRLILQLHSLPFINTLNFQLLILAMFYNVNMNGLFHVRFGASKTLTTIFTIHSPADKDFPRSPVSSVEIVTRKPN